MAEMLNSTAPELLECDIESLTLHWDTKRGTEAYELQLREGENGTWSTLSNSIRGNLIRKKNLDNETTYFFRVRARDRVDWFDWSTVSRGMSVLKPSSKRLEAPIVDSCDSESITVKWGAVEGSTGYELRFREDGKFWVDIKAKINGTVARKKGLRNGLQYYFSVKPVFEEGDSREHEWVFSPSSTAASVMSLHPFIQSIFPSSLQGKNGDVSTADALSGKLVAIYFSASWCGPCKKFTPELAEMYWNMKEANKRIEIIFASCDQDIQSFDRYYQPQPWLAVKFNDPKREQLQAKFDLQSIPRLVLLSPSGTVIEEATVQSFSESAVDSFCSKYL